MDHHQNRVDIANSQSKTRTRPPAGPVFSPTVARRPTFIVRPTGQMPCL